jgi:RES domain-containing protein
MPSDRTVWRIIPGRYADRAFDGEGTRLYGGRWNHAGTSLVYCSSTLSLAALEYFVNLEPLLAPPDLVAVPAEIPAEVSRSELDAALLPPDWRSYPAPERLQDLGSGWIRSGGSAVLFVPSAVIPRERNVLLNPAHPDFPKIRIGTPEPFSYDPRMWK